MKLAAVILAAVASTAAAKGLSGTKRVSKLLESARRLNQEEEEQDMSWAVDFSVKYQGCHHIKQWNAEANEQEDVRIATKRLVRFRMCPSDQCSASAAGGCQSGFGDYIVDMDTFLNMYWEAKEQDKEIGCQNYINEYCEPECENANDDESCQYNCLFNAGLEECIEGDANGEDGDQQEAIEVDQFFECQQLEPAQDEDGNQQEEYDENGDVINYFAGPYCSEQGGAIKIGVFTDDQCTEFSGKSFYQITGYELAYTEESIVEEGCRSCKEAEEYDANAAYENNNGEEEEEAAEPRQLCDELYRSAGKCETYLGETLGGDINENACNYMKGIKMVRTDGLLDVSDARPSAVATAFIVIFAMAFAAMAFYVWYLRTRLGVKKNSLL
eukprot:CAMPEP_0172441570 /NCGR_PEP_ID=MMETSP1065-20121228/2115_1 /TAXON_ID=265537 /ORGANISM="Amphiprora paludosa, Strain CCMP125" /LENGTH=384 /DNA_ID=CAMNT_0013191021 /DNA_START=55 /DNA_END=1209 /DNA_ORIENTATION=-